MLIPTLKVSGQCRTCGRILELKSISAIIPPHDSQGKSCGGSADYPANERFLIQTDKEAKEVAIFLQGDDHAICFRTPEKGHGNGCCSGTVCCKIRQKLAVALATYCLEQHLLPKNT